MAYFFARYPNAKAEPHNMDAWYSDIIDEISDSHFEVVVKYLAKNHQYQNWQNFGGIILDTAKSVRLKETPQPLQITNGLPAEEHAAGCSSATWPGRWG